MRYMRRPGRLASLTRGCTSCTRLPTQLRLADVRSFFFFKQKTAYEILADWSSDVCSSDLGKPPVLTLRGHADGSPVRQIRDSMHDGVLHQGLQQERRNQQESGLVLNGFFDAQPGAEAYF